MTTQISWRPSASIETLRYRASLLNEVRAFFQARGVLEVETPALSQASVTDIHLRAFDTCFVSPIAPHPQKLYLQTSPEYAMKRLLCAGSGCIFQICKSFRNEEAGRHHNPEFTMLEWYRVGFNHWQLIDEIDQLLQRVLSTESLDTVSYQQAFITHCQIDPLDCTDEQLNACAVAFGFEHIAHSQPDRDTLLQLLCSQVVEPKIGQDRPVALVNFPSSQAALARIDQNDPRVANRFEIYYKGLELANGYHELNQPQEQIRRFEQDNVRRQEAGLPLLEIDPYLMAAMHYGMPDCAGVAMGIDRLMMLASEAKHIRDVVAFDIKRA